MIPAQAVEVAAKEFAAVADPLGDWERQTPGYHRHYFVMAKRILEAAAPYMLQEAKAEAWSHGHYDGAVDQMLHMENGGAKTTPNPYMLNNEGEK